MSAKDVSIATASKFASTTRRTKRSRLTRVWGGLRMKATMFHDAPALLGTERQGPDSAGRAHRQPSDLWHYRHLWNPQLTSAGSIMPGFSYLFLAGSTDIQPRAAPDAEALVAYLLALKTNEAPKPVAVAGGLTLDTPLPVGNAQTGQALFSIARLCGLPFASSRKKRSSGLRCLGIGKTTLTRIKAPDYRGKATVAETYIKESILDPSAYIVPGFPDAMLKDYALKLNAQAVGRPASHSCKRSRQDPSCPTRGEACTWGESSSLAPIWL